MIIFSNTCESIIKAFLLSKLTGDCVTNNSDTDTLFFSCDTPTTADDYAINDLTDRFYDAFHIHPDWLFSHRGCDLKLHICYALRHQSQNKHTVIFMALEDAFFKGIEYCLQGASQNSKKLRSLYTDVQHDVWRMIGFIRFKKAGLQCLVAEPMLCHDTIDLILIEFQKRYPNHRIVLVTDDKCMAIEAGKLYDVDKDAYSDALKHDDFDEMWESYYRSQYIEGRKNIRLAASHIPKKYWDWMPEGQILREEEKK